jgi:putative membrane protein
MVLMPSWFQQGWMHVKLTFVILLFVYHYKTHIYYKQLQRGDIKVTSNFMRIWNEGATFILFAVVFLVILKSSINWIFGVVGIIVLAVLIMLGFKLYKNIRAKNPDA